MNEKDRIRCKLCKETSYGRTYMKQHILKKHFNDLTETLIPFKRKLNGKA